MRRPTATAAPDPDDQFRMAKLLVQGRLITPEQLSDAVARREDTGETLTEILLDQGWVKPFQLLQARAHLHGMRAIDLGVTKPDPGAVARLPATLARWHRVIPVASIRDQAGEEVLVIAIPDPTDLPACEPIRAFVGARVQFVLAAREQITTAVAEHYPTEPTPASE